MRSMKRRNALSELLKAMTCSLLYAYLHCQPPFISNCYDLVQTIIRAAKSGYQEEFFNLGPFVE